MMKITSLLPTSVQIPPTLAKPKVTTKLTGKHMPKKALSVYSLGKDF